MAVEILIMPLPLSDSIYDQNGLPASLPVAQEPLPTSRPTMAQRVVDQLLGTNGQERYQLWPERVVRDALSAPHDVLNSKVPLTSDQMIKPALDISALAGTGGLAGVGEEARAALGAGPFLRPALKYGDKIYKAPIKDASNPLFMGAEHSDAIPQSLLPEFTRQAMSGEDISNFNFGFINHKGQFLDREKALDYGIKEGLLSPHDAKFGALTSTMMADSSKPAAAIEGLAKYEHPQDLEDASNVWAQGKMSNKEFKNLVKSKGWDIDKYELQRSRKSTIEVIDPNGNYHELQP